MQHESEGRLLELYYSRKFILYIAGIADSVKNLQYPLGSQDAYI